MDQKMILLGIGLGAYFLWMMIPCVVTNTDLCLYFATYLLILFLPIVLGMKKEEVDVKLE